MMLRQRGIGLPELMIGLAIVASITALVWGAKAWIEGYGDDRYKAGEAAANLRWQQRESKELADANRTIAFLNDAYGKLEVEQAARQNAIDAQRRKEIVDAQKKLDAAVAAARAGTLVLRDPGRAAACPGAADGRAADTATGDAGGSGKERAGLSAEASVFLLGLTAEADQLARDRNTLIDSYNGLWDYCMAHPKPPSSP